MGKQTKMTRQKESTTANRHLAQWRVKWLIEHSTSHQLLWCIERLVFRNPLLRQASNHLRHLSRPDFG